MNAREVALLFLEDSAFSFYYYVALEIQGLVTISLTVTFYNPISLLEHPAGFVIFQKRSSISAPS